MAGRRGDTHRIIRWLWTSRRIDARLVRLALLPASGLWWSAMALRNRAYDKRWLPRHDLPLPAVAIGNLSVGGSGKTPVTAWVARYFADQGLKPGILLRGYGGGDEAGVHTHAVPEAAVVADPDRVAGAERALARGAEVLVLDDAYQRRDVHRDCDIVLVSAETSRAVGWPLPAGPWRESRQSLSRADIVIVTRKRATAAAALELVRELSRAVTVPVAMVHLSLARLEGLVSGRAVPPSVLAGKRVVAAAAIADPGSFVAQVKGTGARVQVATWKDHHEFRDEDLAWLAHATRRADHLVITSKDAAKLRDRWPANVPEPFVAELDLVWEEGKDDVTAALDAVVAHLARHSP